MDSISSRRAFCPHRSYNFVVRLSAWLAICCVIFRIPSFSRCVAMPDHPRYWRFSVAALGGGGFFNPRHSVDSEFTTFAQCVGNRGDLGCLSGCKSRTEMYTGILHRNTMGANPNTALTVLFQTGLVCPFERRTKIKVKRTGGLEGYRSCHLNSLDSYESLVNTIHLTA